MGFSANVLKFDVNNNVEDFTFVLSTKNYTHICKLNNVKRDTVNCKENLNGADELSFEIYKELDEEIQENWDKITDLKLVWVKELNEYFEITVSYDDKLDAVKTIVGTSLCEAELSQRNLYGTEINTDADIARDDYVITKFYNKDNPKASLLHRVLKDKAQDYTIKYVDKSLWDLQRSFSIDGTSIYDFLTGECAEQFNCLFVFNSVDRSISVYDLYTTCKKCGYRGDYNNVCPKCGSDLLNYFGEDTTIIVNKENLTDSVKFETDVDSIKNCFKLTAGDDEMTAIVTQLNQNGTSYLYYISDEQKEDMSDELVSKIESYDKLYVSYTEEYEHLVQDFYDVSDNISYYESGMMPGDSSDENRSDNAGNDKNNTESIAKQEATKLTVANLSPIGVSTLSKSTTTSLVDNAVKNYARVFVKTQYVKLEISESTFTYKGTDSNGYNYGQWIGKFKVTNYSDSEDIAYSDKLTITVHDNYEDFLKQKVAKDIDLNSDDEDGSIFDVLAIDNLDNFKDALKLYCLNRLNSFKDAIQTALDTLQHCNQAAKGADFYDDIYVSYYNKLVACDNEIIIRETTINELETQREQIDSKIRTIQEALNLENYLGEELYTEFCSYRREQEYSNSNYISDGLDNAGKIAKAKEFIETAKKELIKSATRQHSISTTLYNLLLMPEFKVIVNKFALGNFIRVQVDKDIYRLRLIHYELNFSEIQTLNVEFSDMVKVNDDVSDVQSILSSAKSMAGNFSYVSKQAEKGNDANNTIIDFVKEGLNSANIAITNNVNEEISLTKQGLIAKTWDDIEGDYSPKQAKFTHNLLCFTRDNWKNVSLALGEHDYYKYVDNVLVKLTDYGLTSDFVTAGVINGSQMIGGDIYSQNYSSTTGTHINLNDGTFSFAGKNLTYDGKVLVLTGKINAKAGGTIGGWNIGDKSLYNNTTSMTSKTVGTYIGTDGIRQYASDTAYINIQNGIITAKGANISGTITTKNITATGGTIGGWNVSSTAIYSGTSVTNNASGAVGISSSDFTRTINGASRTGLRFAIGSNFGVTKTGGLYASNVDISGKITATSGSFTGSITSTSGTIGGWTIKSSALYNGTDSMSSATVGTYIGTDGIRQYSKSAYVNIQNGIITAKGAHITGTIYSTDGSIGNLNIDGNGIHASASGSGCGMLNSSTIADGNGKIAFFAGADTSNIGSAPYRVYHNGKVVCSKLYVTGGSFSIGSAFSVNSSGTTTISAGSIGNWEIGGTDGSLKGRSAEGRRSLGLYPNGYPVGGHTFYLIVWDYGGSVPICGLASDGWHTSIS